MVRCALVRPEDEKFVVERINRAEVEEKHSIMRITLNNFLLIDEIYIYYKPPLEDPKEEVNALSNKNN